MELINFWWQTFVDLKAWQMILFVIYLIYFVVMTYSFYVNSMQYGIIKGYKVTIFDNDTHFRLHHIFRIIWDLPPALVGLFLPLLEEVFTFKLHEFKKDEK